MDLEEARAAPVVEAGVVEVPAAVAHLALDQLLAHCTTLLAHCAGAKSNPTLGAVPATDTTRRT